jgi:hypothetical protein
MKTITLFIGLLFCMLGVSSQTYYYNNTKTFNESGYTYQCDVPSHKLVTLYNKDNKLTYTPLVEKSTGKPYFPSERRISLVASETWTKPKCYAIVNNAFSAAEKQRIKVTEEVMGVVMYISPDTGKVTEVKFSFHATSPYATVPVSVYRKIETELKNNIWFTTTAEAKKLNYVMHFWNQEVK